MAATRNKQCHQLLRLPRQPSSRAPTYEPSCALTPNREKDRWSTMPVQAPATEHEALSKACCKCAADSKHCAEDSSALRNTCSSPQWTRRGKTGSLLHRTSPCAQTVLGAAAQRAQLQQDPPTSSRRTQPVGQSLVQEQQQNQIRKPTGPAHLLPGAVKPTTVKQWHERNKKTP